MHVLYLSGNNLDVIQHIRWDGRGRIRYWPRKQHKFCDNIRDIQAQVVLVSCGLVRLGVGRNNTWSYLHFVTQYGRVHHSLPDASSHGNKCSHVCIHQINTSVLEKRN